MPRVLLLNADWLPFQFITEIRAIKLLMRGCAEIITVIESPSMWDCHYATVTTSFQVPATIRLCVRVNIKSTIPRFRKRILFNRDGWSCQYCSKKLVLNNMTIDHVIPKCKGGKTTWRNCVVCCKSCNKTKGAKLPYEVNMTLLKKPVEPRIIHFWDTNGKEGWHLDWTTFISPSDICSFSD